MSSAYCLSLLCTFLLHSLRDVFDDDIEKGKECWFEIVHIFVPILYKKKVALKIRIDEDLKG